MNFLNLVRGILVKILQGIESQTSQHIDTDKTIVEIMEAFEIIKSKIDYIAQKRIDECRLSSVSNSMNSSSDIKKLLARFHQFKNECVNQIKFIDVYIKNKDFVSFYMTKSDFKYVKDRIHSHSEELTYLKNHQSFSNTEPKATHKNDVKAIEQTLLKIISNLKNNSDFNNLRSFTTSAAVNYKSQIGQNSSMSKFSLQNRVQNTSSREGQKLNVDYAHKKMSYSVPTSPASNQHSRDRYSKQTKKHTRLPQIVNKSSQDIYETGSLVSDISVPHSQKNSPNHNGKQLVGVRPAYSPPHSTKNL